jgi:UDP-glucose 4-epimerase
MKVLVTGGCGFISSHTIDLLTKNGYEVLAIDIVLDKNRINNSAKYVKVNILSKKLFEVFKKFSPNIVFHFAAQTNLRSSIEDPKKDAKLNIFGTINVLEACRKYNAKKIIYSSSAAVYGEPKYLPVDENHPTKPESPYGLSKLVGELYIQLYNKLFGLDFTILRYSNVFGPRQNNRSDSGVISVFINKILKNESPIIFGDGKQTRDFIFVEDVARANLLAINWKNDIYNISSSKEISVLDLFEKIRKILKKDIKPTFAEPKKEVKRIALSNKKAIKMGWNQKIDFEEGLKKTIEYFEMKSRNL